MTTSSPASLLCTLGTSWAVVPEAYLLGNGSAAYREVTVLTTDSPKTTQAAQDCRDWFSSHAPETKLRILHIAGLEDLANQDDHHYFEEALYRCSFHHLRSYPPLHICLAGGFKTMSAAAQEAGNLIGCAKLFHIAAVFGITTNDDQQIRDAIRREKIRYVDLGVRAGWPTIRALASDAPGIPAEGKSIEIRNTSLRDKIQNRLENAQNLASSEAELATLPFPQLARWSPGQRDALGEKLDPEKDLDWVQSLPKVELHCHLGGFATHGAPLQAVRDAAEDPDNLPLFDEPDLPEGWPLPGKPSGLEAYRKLGDASGSTLLRDPGCLRKQIELLEAHLRQQNINYAEIRCSPANYADSKRGRSPWTVLCEIRDHFERLQREAGGSGPLVNLIVIATRRGEEAGDFRTPISRHLALAATAAEHWTDSSKPRIVGVDLAGFEDRTTRAHYFREDFTAALRLGMGVTIHAGENDHAEGIWSAILDLNARRLGHALHLTSSPSLLQTVADRRIGIEMCPYANFQIIGYNLDTSEASREYPLLAYLKAGVPVTVNTDNIGISAASLTDNFLLLPRLCPGITRLDLLQLIRNSIDQSFLPANERGKILARPIPAP